MKLSPFIHTLKTPLGYFFYDVNTNRIISISKMVYDFLAEVERNEIYPLSCDICKDVENEITALKENGFLQCFRPSKMKHNYDKILEFQLNENIEQITLQITQQCNFRCAYCAYAVPDFSTQRHHSPKRMTLETARAVVDFFVKHSVGQSKVCLGFYGGEPLLEFDLIKDIADYAEKSFDGKELKFTITTNGSLLTKEVCEFLSLRNIDVLVSLDGTEKTHNKSRKFAISGQETYKTIEKNLLMIKNKFPSLYKKIMLNVVVDPRNSADEMHNAFKKELFDGIVNIRSTLIDDTFSVEKTVPSDSYRIETEIQMFKGYMSIFKRYPQEKVSRLIMGSISEQREKFQKEMKPYSRLAEETSHAGPCIPGQKRLFVNTDGVFFPCERVSETSEVMKIGNIHMGFDIDKSRKILNICQLTADTCKNCWAISQCSICARLCDNNGELSSELKLSNCAVIRASIEDKFLNHICTPLCISNGILGNICFYITKF